VVINARLEGNGNVDSPLNEPNGSKPATSTPVTTLPSLLRAGSARAFMFIAKSESKRRIKRLFIIQLPVKSVVLVCHHPRNPAGTTTDNGLVYVGLIRLTAATTRTRLSNNHTSAYVASTNLKGTELLVFDLGQFITRLERP
jgi:hypothetical protein